MAGLYIHIPFCRSKCAYCDFFSLPLDKTLKETRHEIMRRYCVAVLAEFKSRRHEINENFETVYIGGGTPTVIPDDILLPFISSVKALVTSDSNHLREFTIEANPEDITPAYINNLKEAGIDRISIGIQSFDSRQLHYISRKHDAETSLGALKILHDSGVNYSADLIYGLPGQSIKDWQKQLETLLSFTPPHFSAYLLSYEPGTKLYVRREKGFVNETDEETASRMYQVLTEIASKYGYHHYEISNFALPGHEAVHNSSYWNLTPYLGLGCSAHSFDGSMRRINPLNLRQYLTSILGDPPHTVFITEPETIVNKLNDYIITSLRTSSGLSLSQAETIGGSDLKSYLIANLSKEIAKDNLIETDGRVRIPENLWLTADSILREVIVDPTE
ncbi:MAG: radical SAM family heme chaperone HemW [Muribaculaceae bacterium]|nr:radical SAM family heme chaperone HemW [Muribaculaceae bacterium]